MRAIHPGDFARLRQALASLASTDAGGDVDAARIFDAVHGTASPEERRAVVDELAANPAAAEAWRLAHAMSADVMAAAPAAPPRWRWISIAAAALLATFGLGWQLAPSWQTPEPTYRSIEPRAIASALPPGVTLSRASAVLRWTEVAGARYRVRVLTTDLMVLEESGELAVREYTLNEETLRRIPPGGEIFWQVEARVSGETVIVSPTFSIRVP